MRSRRIRPRRLFLSFAVLLLVAAVGAKFLDLSRLTVKAPTKSSWDHSVAITYLLQRGSVFPLSGTLNIVDVKGNRLLKVNAAEKVLWGGSVTASDINPNPNDGPLAVNSDTHQVVRVYTVSSTTGRVLHTYGLRQGSAPGYRFLPEDSYGLSHYRVLMTDPGNGRVILVNWLTNQILWQYRHRGIESEHPDCLYEVHNAIPMTNAHALITDGDQPGMLRQRWDVSREMVGHTVLPRAIHYPSDAVPVGPHLYAITDHTNPAGLNVVNRSGHIVWSCPVASGPGRANHASSINRLPNKHFWVSDGGTDRGIVIDPQTDKIIWPHGATYVSGSGSDQLMGSTEAKTASEPWPPNVSGEGASAITL